MKTTKTYKMTATERTMKLGHEVTMTNEIYKVPVGYTWTLTEKQFKKEKFVHFVFGHGDKTIIPVEALKVVEVTTYTTEKRKVIRK